MLQPLVPMAALSEGEHVLVRVDVRGRNLELLIGLAEGRYFAVHAVCPHAGASLAGGRVDGCEIVCPRHGARFDVRDGRCTAPPAEQSIACFPVLLEAGKVCVDL